MSPYGWSFGSAVPPVEGGTPWLRKSIAPASRSRIGGAACGSAATRSSRTTAPAALDGSVPCAGGRFITEYGSRAVGISCSASTLVLLPATRARSSSRGVSASVNGVAGRTTSRSPDAEAASPSPTEAVSSSPVARSRGRSSSVELGSEGGTTPTCGDRLVPDGRSVTRKTVASGAASSERDRCKTTDPPIKATARVAASRYVRRTEPRPAFSPSASNGTTRDRSGISASSRSNRSAAGGGASVSRRRRSISRSSGWLMSRSPRGRSPAERAPSSVVCGRRRR